MASIFIQASKYIILFLFFVYIFGAFYVFRYNKEPEEQKTIYIVQKIMLYVIHGIGFFCLYLQNPDVKIIGFYLMQVVLLSVLFFLFHFMYEKSNILLLNNMCMFLVISFIELTRISFDKAFRQFIFLIIGVVAMLVIPLFLQKGSVFRNFSAVYFVVGTLLLGLVVVIGATDYGAKLVLSIGSISFQPSEFVKIIFVFFVASMLYKKSDFKRILFTSMLSALFVLLLVASKDLGGALLYFMSYLIMIYVASKKRRYLAVGFGLMGIACVAGYFLFSHVRTRVFAWLNPLADIDRQGYQICQSLFGIGTGGWFGLGVGEGIPTKIPVVEKDFIFSAISEEFGAVFAICMILLCFSCFMMIINIAMQMRDRFYKLVAVGLATLYAMQVTLTIGGAIKFIPSTGVTLPLVSYGGSSLLSTLIMFGIVQGLYMRKAYGGKGKSKTDKQKEGKEFFLVIYLFLAIFVGMILYLSYFVGFKSEKFINNEYNGLWTLFEEDVKKGQIITSDRYVIAETITDDNGKEVRHYPYANQFAHVTGYSSNGRTALEQQFNFHLLRSSVSGWEQVMSDLTGIKMPGNNVITTVRYDLQKIAYDSLGNYNGAVIVMQPSTGKILAMVSKEDYNPNTLLSDWDMIQEGSSLFNRATQGQYTPGSVFKMFTTLAYIKSNPDTYEEYSFECTGAYTKDGKTVHCAGKAAHGTLDLKNSFVYSCNCSYARMMEDIDIEMMQELCDSWLFNQSLPITLESSKSSFTLTETDTNAIKMDTAFGQGKTLVSPLHMVMIASAISNDGVAMHPSLYEQLETHDGTVIEKPENLEYKTLFSAEEVEILSEFMRATVTTGTSGDLYSDNFVAYGKTGTAQTSSDLNLTNAWFVGYAEKEGYEDIAIAVVVEKSGSGAVYASPIARRIFDAYFAQ